MLKFKFEYHFVVSLNNLFEISWVFVYAHAYLSLILYMSEMYDAKNRKKHGDSKVRSRFENMRKEWKVTPCSFADRQQVQA
jgi:hypothetical protein